MAQKKKAAPVREKAVVLGVVDTKAKSIRGGAIGELIDELKKLADKKSQASAALEAAKEAYTVAESRVLSELARNRLASGRGRTAQATIGSHVVPNVTDWDALYKWVIKTKDLSIFQRRVSATHWEELISAKRAVAGIMPVTLTKLSLTKVGK